MFHIIAGGTQSFNSARSGALFFIRYIFFDICNLTFDHKKYHMQPFQFCTFITYKVFLYIMAMWKSFDKVLSMKIRVNGTEKKTYTLWCPGCKDLHRIDDTWTWDGNEEEPTISPSIKVTNAGGMIPVKNTRTCHSFVRKGEWEFLTDSTHKLAGLQVSMVDIPEGYFE